MFYARNLYDIQTSGSWTDNFVFCFLKPFIMVQMSAKTTTIVEAEMLLKQEKDLLKNDQPVAEDTAKTYDAKPLKPVRQEIIWINVVAITLLHIIAVKCFFSYMLHLQLKTILWSECDTIGFIVDSVLYRHRFNETLNHLISISDIARKIN